MTEQIKREKRIRIIRLLSFGLSGSINLLSRRGAVYFIDVDYISCEIERLINYLDDNRLRKIIHDLYRDKRKGKLIYITATALCHLANRYGQNFLALPFVVGDFGLTTDYQTLRKGFVTVLLGVFGPLMIIGSPTSLIVALILGTSGLKVALTNLDFIPTEIIKIGTWQERNFYRFLGSWNGEIKIQEEEVLDFNWFTFEKAMQLQLAFDYKEIVELLYKKKLL